MEGSDQQGAGPRGRRAGLAIPLPGVMVAVLVLTLLSQ